MKEENKVNTPAPVVTAVPATVVKPAAPPASKPVPLPLRDRLVAVLLGHHGILHDNALQHLVDRVLAEIARK